MIRRAGVGSDSCPACCGGAVGAAAAVSSCGVGGSGAAARLLQRRRRYTCRPQTPARPPRVAAAPPGRAWCGSDPGETGLDLSQQGAEPLSWRGVLLL